LRYDLYIERPTQKQLAKIPRPYRDRIINSIRNLAVEPRPDGAKKLAGREGWRIRVGDYRVIYEIRDDQLHVLIVTIRHRREVYRR
jgi:mRNA interferase RelE/StbE